jgi:RNA polymerase primary sigma factor
LPSEQVSDRPDRRHDGPAQSRWASTSSTADEETEEAEDSVEEETAAVGNLDDEEVGRTDDPVRMYLREMGSVELLSREGEIAIAKRIEAGRDMMIGGIGESPITTVHHRLARQAEGGRDACCATSSTSTPPWAAARPGTDRGREGGPRRERRGRGERRKTPKGAAALERGQIRRRRRSELSLAAMEAQLLPGVLETFDKIASLYKKLEKVQQKRLETHQGRRRAQPALGEELREAEARDGRSDARHPAQQQPDRGAGRRDVRPQPLMVGLEGQLLRLRRRPA